MISKTVNKLFKGNIFFPIQFILEIFGYLNDSIFLFKIAVVLILFYCLVKGTEQKYVINPYYLFVLTPISLLLYYNIGSDFFLDLTIDTWLLITCNVDALLIGLSLTKAIRFREKIRSNYSLNKTYYTLAWIFTLIGIIPSLVYKFTGFDIPLAYIISMLGVAGIMCAMATKNKMLIVLICLIYMFPIFLGGASKTGILTLLLTLIISFEKLYIPRNSLKRIKRARKNILIWCILAIPIMIFSFSFANKERENTSAEESLEYYGSRVEWNMNASYFIPYMYLVTPWSNLQYVTEKQDQRSYGYWLTKPILGVFLGDSLKQPQFEPKAYSSFNTFSFIALHFKDFGYWGSLIISLFLGFFIKKVYTLYIQSNNPFDATSYVFTAQATVELFFSNHFFGQSYPIMIVIVMYLIKKLLRI